VVEYKKVNGSLGMSEPNDLNGKMILAMQEWCPKQRNK